MGNLVINANNYSGATSIQVRYRLYNSGASYTELTLAQAHLPYTINNLPNGQYEVGVRKQCNNGGWSDWAVSNSPACAQPSNFAVSRSGSNFAIIYGLAAGQQKIQIEITDPNNGKQVISHSGNSDNFTQAISPLIDGTYSLRARGICDDTITPPFISDWGSPVTVVVSSVCQAPVIGVIANQASNSTTITKRINLTGYTANVRIVVTDNATGGAIQNSIVSTAGYVDVTLFKNKTYTVQVVNQCPGGAEQGSNVTIQTTSIQVSAKYSASSTDVCSAPAGPVYLSSNYADIANGATVYTDAGLTTVLSGFSYITNATGDIFNINSSTGVVGADTGNNC